ncbi:flagellar protein FlaG [Halanaerobiaceae bacterium Z-7014]|uniref:Flagellar protein FlaG n=1 Tax=Halonatronomonas betaini TaxID=2778430 RepID=A0A931AWA5_9FIRM|nr:flagellar protein FlaG [Halonatronomonas betaini]MBF8437859.1 flagellar protein FlaG [Halonatronomonas betaini]
MRVEGTQSIPEPQRGVSGANDRQSTSRSASGGSSEPTQVSTEDFIREDALSQDEIDQHMEEIEHELKRLNETMRTFDRGLNFELHEDTGRHIVQVMDIIEDEIIREIPPEEVLDISAKINEMIGLVIDVRI